MNDNDSFKGQHVPPQLDELLWQRLIRNLRLGYRTIVEDLADLEANDLEILLALAIRDEYVSLDTYSNLSILEERGLGRFELPAGYRRWITRERLRFIERLMEMEIDSVAKLVFTR